MYITLLYHKITYKFNNFIYFYERSQRPIIDNKIIIDSKNHNE